MLHISQRTYSRYEREEADLPIDLLVKPAVFYGISVDELLGITDERVQKFARRP